MSVFTSYSIRCDTCIKSLKCFGQERFHDLKNAEEQASERGWIKLGRKHKCLNCIEKGK